MWSETLLRVLSRQRVSYLPIWSCRRQDRLQLIRFRPSVLPSVRLCSTDTSSADASPEGVSIEIQHGLPRVTVPLPSRNEPCQFTLKPVTNTIGDFLVMLQAEDHGIDRAVIRTPSGVRIASTTSIQTLLQDPFDLVINDTKFRVDPPDPLVPPVTESPGAMPREQLQNLGDVRALVGQLYEALHVEEYNAAQEQRLVKELEALQEDLAPLENQRKYLAEQAERRSNQLTWLGLGLMSVQFGILARLTWWEYSWDIMEPVTYFVTYGTAMACYAYFVLTKQDYLLPDVKDRQYLLTFHKRAKRHDWDVEKYNRLKDGVLAIERDLQRLRDPLRTKIGVKQIGDGGSSSILGAQVNIGNMLDSIKEKLKSS